MLSAAHVLAMDAKNLLDVVDSIRIKYREVDEMICNGGSVASGSVASGSDVDGVDYHAQRPLSVSADEHQDQHSGKMNAGSLSLRPNDPQSKNSTLIRIFTFCQKVEKYEKNPSNCSKIEYFSKYFFFRVKALPKSGLRAFSPDSVAPSRASTVLILQNSCKIEMWRVFT